MDKRRVVDGAGRFALEIEAAEEPRLTSHPGYSRLVVPLGTMQPINCFIYDAPLDGGQALTRLLRAAEVGIEFVRFQPPKIEMAGDAPVAFIEAHYRRTEPPEGTGLLKLALSPRTVHPIVCTHEEEHLSATFRRIIRGALESASPSVEFAKVGLGEDDRALVEETWAFRGGEAPTGYSQWRAARLPNGKVHELTVTTLFIPNEAGLETVDTVSVEVSDDQGLLEARYLQVEGTDPVLQLQLGRQTGEQSPEYVVQGRAGLESITTRFSGPPLGTGMDTFSFFRGSAGTTAEPGEDSLTVYRYFPQLALDAPIPVEIERLSSSEGMLHRAGQGQHIHLNEKGLPDGFGKPLGAVLLSRRVFPAIDE